MKKNKNISDNQLRKIFKETALDIPSSGFMENLMVKIEKEAVWKKRKENLVISCQIAAGIATMFSLPALVIYLYILFIPGFVFSFSFPKINLNFDANLIATGLAVLFLLMADTLYRKHIHSKKDV
jgi:hypothetical protein